MAGVGADCEHYTDPCGGWAAKREVAASGAVLVRPDGHVAWKCGDVAAAGCGGTAPGDHASGRSTVEAAACALRGAIGDVGW